MINLRKIFSYNSKINFVILGIFILVIIFIQILNSRAKINNKENNENIVIEDEKNYQSRTTIISDGKVDESTNNKIYDLISDFINYCNNGDIEKAYNILSTDCKNQMFSTVDEFKNKYYKIIFSSKRQFEMQSWITKGGAYTYRITFSGDILSTGGKDINTIEDYYTIVKENNENKLNINNFVSKNVINKDISTNNININIKEVYKYMDYEIYNIEIKNNRNKSILLDTKEKTNTIFVTDNNNNNYASYNHEISNADLLINANFSKNLKIKFSKTYSSNLETTKLTFSDIVIDYSNNENNQTSNTQKARIEIDI